MKQGRQTTRGPARPRPTPTQGLTNNSTGTASNASSSNSHASDTLTTTSSSIGSLERGSPTTADPVYSRTSRKLRAHIRHRIQDVTVPWHRKRYPEAEAHHEISWPVTPTTQHPSSSSSGDESLVPDLDSLTLSRAELNLIKHMEAARHAARTTPKTQQQTTPNEAFDLHLRGGGNDAEPRRRRRRTTLPPRNNSRAPRPDSDRPDSVVWWLAGGKRSRGGKVPTIGELRVRKEVEEANRRFVGFWGTVVGLRRVGKVGLLGGGGGGGGAGEPETIAGGSEASVEDVDAHAGSMRSVGLEGDRAVGGYGGDKVDGGEGVADAIGRGGGSSMEDQSVHGGSAEGAEKCEAAQEESQDGFGERAVDSNDVAEETTPGRADNQDGHSEKSANSQKEDNNQDNHNSTSEAHETAEAVEDEAGERVVDEIDAVAESNSAKSLKEADNQDEHGGKSETREAADTTDDKDGKNAFDSDNLAQESSSLKSTEETGNQDEHSRETEAREAAEAAEATKDPILSGAKDTGV